MLSKSNLLSAFALAASFSGQACAGVEEARPYASLQDSGSPLFPYPYLNNSQFGSTEVVGQGGYVRSAIGLDGGGTPVIQLHATTASTKYSNPSGSASLAYYWEIVGAGNSPVLAHISTAGFLKFDYGFIPNQLDRYNLYPNTINAGVVATFYTNTNSPSGGDQRSYGLQSGGNLNWGVERVEPLSNFTSQNGGNSLLDVSFTTQFDLWVTPNTVNQINMSSIAFLYENTGFVKEYATEHFSITGFIDPVITIDPAYASAYSFSMSAMPSISAVPEPSVLVLFLTGIGLISWRHSSRRSPKWPKSPFEWRYVWQRPQASGLALRPI